MGVQRPAGTGTATLQWVDVSLPPHDSRLTGRSYRCRCPSPRGSVISLATDDASWSPAAQSPKAIGSTPMSFHRGDVDGGLGGADARAGVGIRSWFRSSVGVTGPL